MDCFDAFAPWPAPPAARPSPLSGLALALALALAACSSPPSSDASTDAAGDAATDSGALDGSADADPGSDAAPADASDVPPGPRPVTDCDPLGEGRQCALPWPSNLYLVEDRARRTGYTLAFGPTSLPANRAGRHMDPAPHRRLDGYGVSTPIIVLFPNLDASTLPDETAIERSMAADASILLFEDDGTAVRRVPYFAELDAQETDAARRVLFVRPAVILREATRYVVAFRNLRAAGGAAVAPSPAFVRLRDGTAAGDPALAPRVARFERVFATLQAQGVPRASLTLAWDFVTASSEALHGRMLRIRDDALAAYARGAPLTVTSVTEFARTMDGSGRPVNANIAFEVEGTFEVPEYMRPLRQGGFNGFEMNVDAQGRPARNGTRTPRFWARVPWSAVGGEPAGLVIYGHGLLGSGEQVRGDFNSRIANANNLIFFASSLTGMSEEDYVNVVGSLSELGRFVSITDRLHQGVMEWVLLTRGMRERFAELPQVMARNVRVDRAQVYYSGISQGGIFGATFMAVTPDVTRGHLGVPGVNYSTLLHRSTDFTSFFRSVRNTYPDSRDQAVLLSAVQLLWDMTDPVSYYRHLSAEPFPGNAPHHVLLAPAKGDYQVAVLTNEIVARSGLGVALMANYDDERAPWGITPAAYPHRGSGVVLYDFGNPWPAPGNQPPMDSVGDPHGLPRQRDWHNRQMVHFFRTGEIIDVCGGDGCRPD